MNHQQTYEMAACAVMTALLCILAPLSIPIGPVPVSLAIMVVCLSAYVLGPVPAAFSTAVYLLLGLAGLPVFSGFSGGPAKLAGPTGGFLIGYLFTALAGGFLAERSGRQIIPSVIGLFIGVFLAYLFGTIWFIISANATLPYALSVCVLPFIPLDLVKTILAVVLGKAIRRALMRNGLLQEQQSSYQGQ